MNDEYAAREDLIREAFHRSQKNGTGSEPVSLRSLISLMKKRSANDGLLSSMYFAGARGDHPFFLKNNRIAVGISVLPEDAPKAGVQKRHPHQQEVIFVLKGSLRLEVKRGGLRHSKKLKAGDLFVIEKGWCHRIVPVDNTNAVYLFVKTNPALEPRERSC